MAAVARDRCRPCTPVGYEVVDKGVILVDVVAGDLLINTAAGWTLATAGALEAHGIALQNYYAGQGGCSIGIQGEMDGYTGLVAGAAVYPSGTVAGGTDTTAPAGATIRMRAVNTTRLRYNFV